MLAARSDHTLRPTLRVIDVVAIIVGTVVGAGIFRTPSLVAANATSEAAALGAWVAGGAISLIGALCYAELAAAYPSPGGDYHDLARAFGVRLRFSFCVAAHHRDPDRVHRAARLRHRRLRHQADVARPRLADRLRGADRRDHHRRPRDRRAAGAPDPERAHRRRGRGPGPGDHGRVRARGAGRLFHALGRRRPHAGVRSPDGRSCCSPTGDEPRRRTLPRRSGGPGGASRGLSCGASSRSPPSTCS